MEKKYLYFIILVFFFYYSGLKAQDIHFSQFFSSPLNTNPANTGNFEGSYRFVLNNKNQWKSFANAYRTFAGSFDMGFDDVFIKNSLAGLGLQLNNDIAGDGNFGTTQIYINGSYYIPLIKQHKFYAGIGTNIGYVFHGIDFDQLSFGTQYENDYYDPQLTSEEFWDRRSINYFDFGLGINFIYKNNPGFIPQTGISASHINMPGKSFYNNSEMYLPVKWTISGSFNYKLNERLWIDPLFMILLQQKYREYNVGVMFRYDYNNIGLQSLHFGILTRARDAAILCVGLKYNNIKVTMNYDINISNLTRISRGKGGVEFSLIYTIFRARTFETPYYRKCPDFI